MTEQQNPNAYKIQSIDIINQKDNIAFVMTEAGGYVVEAIPEIGIDVRDVDILFVAISLESAIEKYEDIYG